MTLFIGSGPGHELSGQDPSCLSSSAEYQPLGKCFSLFTLILSPSTRLGAPLCRADKLLSLQCTHWASRHCA